MPRNKKHLEGLLELISQISSEDGNEWFVKKLADRVPSRSNKATTSFPNIADDVPQNVNDIKLYLLLDNIHIIDYSEILDEKTKVQLHMDCIQMGRYRLGKIDNKPNFDEFCRYAHLQAEEMINYFLKNRFITPLAVQEFIKDNNPNYKSEIVATTISSINYSFKLFALKNYGLISGEILQVLLFLGAVRNKISHRSTFEVAIKDEEELYHQFIVRFEKKYLTFEEKNRLLTSDKKLYEEGLYIQEKKAEHWDKIYTVLQKLLISILNKPKENS